MEAGVSDHVWTLDEVISPVRVIAVSVRAKGYLALVLLIMPLVGLAAVFGVDVWSHCLPMEKINRLRWTMKPADIVRILGQPTSTRKYDDGYYRISYSKPFVFCSLDVYFDSHEKMTRLFHDHTDDYASTLVESAKREPEKE